MREPQKVYIKTNIIIRSDGQTNEYGAEILISTSIKDLIDSIANELPELKNREFTAFINYAEIEEQDIPLNEQFSFEIGDEKIVLEIKFTDEPKKRTFVRRIKKKNRATSSPETH